MKRIVSTTAGRSTSDDVGDRLAHVERLEHGERLGVLVDERREAVHDLHARARRHLRPAAGLECLFRGRHRAVDVLGGAGRHLGDHLAVGGVDALEASALLRVDELAVDEQPRLGLLLRLVGDGLPAGVGRAWRRPGYSSCLPLVVRIQYAEPLAARQAHRRSRSRPRGRSRGSGRSRKAASPSAATSAEKRAATRQNSSTASGRRWRRLPSSGAMRRRSHEPGRFGGTERRHRVHDVGQRLDVHAAGAEEDDRTELLVVDHAEQHLDAVRRDHRRDQHARSDALREVAVRARRPPSSSARTGGCPAGRSCGRGRALRSSARPG